MASIPSPTRQRPAFANNRRLSLEPCLRALTWRRFGFVLSLCIVFVVRQLAMSFADADKLTCDCTAPPAVTFLVVRHFLAALPMLVLVSIAEDLTRDSQRMLRITVLTAAVLVGAAAFAVVYQLMQPEIQRVALMQSSTQRAALVAYFARAAFYGGLATAVLYWFARERDERNTLHEATLANVMLERQTIEARLQALQAQIEPHFLFNTLANIRLLYEVEPNQARRLLRSLGAYLAAALPQMREAGSTTVGREFAMVSAYLRIFQIRMGERLQVDIDVPANVQHAELPPMMLLTLVENAIKHGLDPRPRGGTIRIRAVREGDTLRVVIEDDGIGFMKGKGSGVGLANIRARLRLLYGVAGRLALDANATGGVTASIELPCTIGAAPACA